MERDIGGNLSYLGFDQNPCEFYLMFLSQEIEIKLCQIYTKIGIYQILCKIRRFKQIIFSKYATNLKKTISQRSLSNWGLILKFNNFSFLIDINNVIITFVSRDQSSGPMIRTFSEWLRICFINFSRH